MAAAKKEKNKDQGEAASTANAEKEAKAKEIEAIVKEYNTLAEKNNEPTVTTFRNAETGQTRLEKLKRKIEANQEPPKCVSVQTFKRPTRRVFSKIKKIKEHPGKGFRIKRWALYKDGMTMLQIGQTEGLDTKDVLYWVNNGFMELQEPSDEEFEKLKEKFIKEQTAAA